MTITDVCRLCLTKEDLVWIFDKRFENSENMKEVIFITTGVEIHQKDLITQKICQTCCNVTIKMFQFRSKALKNDKFLKATSEDNKVDLNIKIANSTVIACVKPEVEKIKPLQELPSKPSYTIHPSVKALFKIHPKIRLPTICLKSHIEPFVSLPMDDVESYFRKRKLDFGEHIKFAIQSHKKVAMKKTSIHIQATRTCSNAAKDSPIVPNATEDENVFKIKKPEPFSNDKTAELPPKLLLHSERKILGDQLASQCSPQNNCVGPAHPTVPLSDNPKLPFSENAPVIKKRKISQHEHSSRKENNKDSLMEVLELAPTKPTHTFNANQEILTTSKSIPNTVTLPAPVNLESPVSLSYLDKSVPLLICDICNSIQYNAKDLRRHKLKHMRCQFCKVRFRSISSKTQHLKDACPIKNMMLNLPDVKLEKIEFNVKLRHKYEEAFREFPPLKIKKSTLIHHSSIIISTARDLIENKDLRNHIKTNCETSLKPIQNHITVENSEQDIIEILSDDDEVQKISSKPSVIHNAKVNSKRANEKSNVLKNMRSVPSTSLTHNITKDTTKPTDTSIGTIQIPESIIYNTVSIVKPDIQITNCDVDVIDFIDPKTSDIAILKKLLGHGTLPTNAEKSIQTELPRNSSITTNVADPTCSLTNLKQLMHVYKIPVQIKFGDFKVSYHNNSDEPKPPKKLCLWNDLKPTDKKKPCTKKRNKLIVPLPSTASYNSTRVLSSAPRSSLTSSQSFKIINSSNKACRTAHVSTIRNGSSPNQNETILSQNEHHNTSISEVNTSAAINNLLLNESQDISSASQTKQSSIPTISASNTSAITNNLIGTPLSSSNLQVSSNMITTNALNSVIDNQTPLTSVDTISSNMVAANPLLNTFMESQTTLTSINTTIPTLSNSATSLNTLTVNNTYSTPFISNPTITYFQTPNLASQTISTATSSLPGVSPAGNMIPFHIGVTPLNPPTVIAASDNVTLLQTNNATPVSNAAPYPTGLIRVRNVSELT